MDTEGFFTSEQVFEVLDGFNPWWTGRQPPVPPYRRLAYHACRRYLDEAALKRAILLSGARRVGKTTVLLQVAEALVSEGREPRSIFYLSLDHPVVKLLTLPELLRLYHERVHPEGSPAVLLLDEVQYSRDWDLQLKHLVDHKPFYRILATGSSSLVHRRRLAESGVGRWVRVPMPTLSFYEFLQIRGEAPTDVPADLRTSQFFHFSEADLMELGRRFRSVMPLFQRYLLVGGFPETAKLADIDLSQRLLREDVVERVLKRDMTAVFRIRNVDDLERLFLYICVNTGGILAVQTCADALQTSASTVRNHLDVLEQANLIYRLPPAGIRGKKVLKARHKVYLVDAALRNAVLLRGEETLNDPREMGVIVETTVLRHLYAFHYWETPQITYWRDSSSGKEVDVVVRGPEYILPVEVKYRTRAALSPDQGIIDFARREGVRYAYWVTQRESDFGLTRFPDLRTRFLRIPAHIFCYVLGQAEQPGLPR
jgi:predicted AAA+ superfamily ATPase